MPCVYTNLIHDNTFIWFVERSEMNLYKLLYSVWCCGYKKANKNLNSVKPK